VVRRVVERGVGMVEVRLSVGELMALYRAAERRIVGGRLILYHPSRRHEGTFVKVRAGDHSFDVEVVVQPLPSMASSRGPPGRGGRGGEGRELRRALVDRERKRRADLDF